MRPSEGGALTAAYQAAAEAHEYLGTDQSQRIDVYGAIDRFGLFLSFRPLDRLLGVCIPEERGVMITTTRPPTIQRYTAAHELGHCVMHHPGLLLDGETEVTGQSTLEREQQAQLFAAYFLMPPDLADDVASRFGIMAGTVQPSQIYQAARDMGASYEATVWHLTNLGRVERHETANLIRSRPTAKRDSAFGVPPANPRTDVWPIEATGEPATVDVTLGDEIVVLLPENRSTGYRWLTRDAQVDVGGNRAGGEGSTGDLDFAPLDPGDEAGDLAPAQAPGHPTEASVLVISSPPPITTSDFDVVVDRYRSPNATTRPVSTRRERQRAKRSTGDATQPIAVGGTGERIIGCVASHVGTSHLDLVLARPHEGARGAVYTWSVIAHVQPEPAVQRLNQILATDLDEQLDGDPPSDAWFEVDTHS